jgi:hypothetical protein
MIEGAGRDKWHADGEGRSLGRQPPVADRAESWPTGRLRVGWPIYRSAGETAAGDIVQSFTIITTASE